MLIIELLGITHHYDDDLGQSRSIKTAHPECRVSIVAAGKVVIEDFKG